MPKRSRKQIWSHSKASSNQQMAFHCWFFSFCKPQYKPFHFKVTLCCGLSYITVDDAISTIIKYGPNMLVDIKNAFRLIPVHPGDRHLLAMQWNNQVYIDGCLPFGLCTAPKLFNLMADLLSWIATQEGIQCIFHYLDDFLIVAPPHSSLCQHSLEKFIRLCDTLGIPLASKKVEGPTSSLLFLGITLDTHHMRFVFLKTNLQEYRRCSYVG